MKAIIRGEYLNKLIESTKRFVSKDNSKPLFSWIKFEFSKEYQSARAIAVDGFKLAVENSVCDIVEEDFTVYLSPNMRKVSKSGAVIIELEGEKVFIQDGEVITGYIQPKGEFLNYKKALEDATTKKIAYKISFNGNLLIEALQSAKASSDVGFRSPIALEFRDETDPIILRTGADNENIKFVLPMRVSSTS